MGVRGCTDINGLHTLKHLRQLRADLDRYVPSSGQTRIALLHLLQLTGELLGTLKRVQVDRLGVGEPARRMGTGDTACANDSKRDHEN